MPKFGCKCGYSFNLTLTPSDNFFWVISDEVIDDTYERIEKDGIDNYFSLLSKEERHILLCPQCERLWFRNGIDEEYEPYIKETK